jgi:hypothetical protein
MTVGKFENLLKDRFRQSSGNPVLYTDGSPTKLVGTIKDAYAPYVGGFSVRKHCF